MKIYDIDFSYPYDKFTADMEEFRDDNNFSNEIVVNSSEETTRNGKHMYKFEVKHRSDGNSITIYFEKNPNNGDVLLAPSSFRSLNETFYKIENLKDGTIYEDNASGLVRDYLQHLAEEVGGKFVSETSAGRITCIVSGKVKGAKKCIVDSSGNVYGAKEVEQVSLDGATAGSMYVNYKTKLPDWIKDKKLEDPNFAAILSDPSTSLGEKYTSVGKYVVTLRMKDEITSDEFKDLFVQAAAADGYANDTTLSTIYKLLK